MNALLLPLLAKNWWIILLRGIVSLLFGFFAFLWPGLTLITLVFFFSAYVLVDGFFSLIAAIRGGTTVPRWWLALTGLLGIAMGVGTFLYPGLTAMVLLVFIAAWFMVHGVLAIIGAIQLRKEIEGEWLLILSGGASVLFGLLMVIFPGAGAMGLIWLVATSSVVFGGLLVGFSFWLRRHQVAS